MSIHRFGSRTRIEGDTSIRLSDWSDTVSVVVATNAERTAFATVMEIDSSGNVRLTGRVQQQVELQ